MQWPAWRVARTAMHQLRRYMADYRWITPGGVDITAHRRPLAERTDLPAADRLKVMLPLYDGPDWQGKDLPGVPLSTLSQAQIERMYLNVVRRGGAETEEKSTLRLVGEAALITAGLGTALYVITKPLRDYGPIF